MGIGAIIALISYVCTIIAGATTYHNFKFDKSSISQFKDQGLSLVRNVQDKVGDTIHNVSDNIATGNGSNNFDGGSNSTNTAPRSKTNLSRTEELLALIEKLCKMKDDGILSEEEFTEKKRKLLDEI